MLVPPALRRHKIHLTKSINTRNPNPSLNEARRSRFRALPLCHIPHARSERRVRRHILHELKDGLCGGGRIAIRQQCPIHSVPDDLRFAAWINGSAIPEDLGADAAGDGVWARGIGAREFVRGEARDLNEIYVVKDFCFFLSWKVGVGVAKWVRKCLPLQQRTKYHF